jgi:hypothetical protein
MPDSIVQSAMHGVVDLQLGVVCEEGLPDAELFIGLVT